MNIYTSITYQFNKVELMKVSGLMNTLTTVCGQSTIGGAKALN